VTDTAPETDAQRRVLLLAHTGRASAREVARECARALNKHGIAVRLLAPEAEDLELDPTSPSGPEGWIEIVDDEEHAGAGCELALVIGGDGSILRAAELTRTSGTPLLGVNLGHVGFLAEAEQDDVAITIEAIV
jgi:NAD+ kinase